MKLKEAIEKKQFVVTSEIQTPIDDTPEDLVRSLAPIRGRVDGVSLTKVELEGVVGDTIKTCQLLQQSQIEPIYQTTTRDKNRLQLQKDLIDAHQSGIENLLVFTEDYRITGDSLQEMMFFHVDAGKLQSVLAHIRQGHTVDGEALPSAPDFLIGSGVESCWGKQVPDLELREMEEMTKVGAGYFLTTPVFDLDQFAKFLKRIDTFGVPVIAEVMILRTAGMARFLNRHLKSGMVPEWMIQKMTREPDRQKASIEIFSDTVNGLKHLCQGVHIITIGGEDKLRLYLDAARLK
ncbi:MAG: methylenetetrahydrofolate reductase [Desulfobacterales bacterium]|jgi:5,10-methylenetetrahydrofolate reductase|nr:methylenetetrahydrofolate reductase [Desulfobacterales bacterium]